MNPLIRFKTIMPLLIPLVLVCIGLSPTTRAEDGDLRNLLGGHQWLVRSFALGDSRASLAAVFNSDGSFKGKLTAPPGGLIPTQRVVGRWQVAQPLLVLQWDMVQGWSQLRSYTNQVTIQITDASAHRLVGIDTGTITTGVRMWTFDRIDN